MLAEFLNVLAGLVIGIATGFYFERRATVAARNENERLRKELSSLRHSVYNMGNSKPPVEAPEASPLAEIVASRARATQGPEGKVLRSKIASYFVAQGYSSKEVAQAIEQCIRDQSVRREGKWLVIP